MALEALYLNRHIEGIDGEMAPEKLDQYKALARIYNRSLGLVTSISLYRPEPVDFALYAATSQHSRLGVLVRDLLLRKSLAEDSILVPGGGKGLSAQQVLMGTLGEAAERLLAVLGSSEASDRVEEATYDELVSNGRAALGPDRLPLFAPEQYGTPGFPFVPFRPHTRIRWIEGNELLTGDPILVPAQLALFSWNPNRSEPQIGYATSGGLAFHTDRREALMHALCEVIERDAINLRWYCRLPPPCVDVDLQQVLVGLGFKSARMTVPGRDARVFLNTVDVPIPVLAVVVADSSGRDGLFLAAGGAGMDRERALLQAVLEIGQAQNANRVFRRESSHVRPNTPVSQLNDFFDAPIYYGFTANRWRTAWYTAGETRLPWEQVPSWPQDTATGYDALLSLLADAGLRPILLDLGPRVWPEVSVVRVFIPELVQASIPSHPYLGHPRFYEVPQRLGLAGRRLRFGDLCDHPPPLP